MQKQSYTHWTEEERSTLLNLVQNQQDQNTLIDRGSQKQISWIQIAQVLTNKTPRQCYDQYLQVKKRREQLEQHTERAKQPKQRKQNFKTHEKIEEKKADDGSIDDDIIQELRKILGEE